MKKESLKRFKPFAISILVTIAIYASTLFIYLYSSGWRFDLSSREVRRTGVISIDSSPSFADVYLNEEDLGRTPKSNTLAIGEYDITLKKNGYFDWKKKVKILEERTTPVFPFLIKNEFELANIYSLEAELINYWSNITNDHLFLLTYTNETYTLLHYNINTEFWMLGSNPSTVVTIPNTQEAPIKKIDLLVSNSGANAVLIIDGEEQKEYYMLQTNKSISYENLVATDLNDFSDYTISWSNSDKYIILESQTDIISYDHNKGVRYFIIKKDSELDKWSTDEQGNFYYFRNIENKNDFLTYTLEQFSLEGNTKQILIPQVYFANSSDYIEDYRSTTIPFSFFRNSPLSTQSVGKIEYFRVFNQASGVFIQTSQASYWYDPEIEKYITISPFPAQYIEMAPDSRRLIYKTGNEYGVFIFEKEDGDHTTTIGSLPIDNINTEQISKINWLSNSTYVIFQEDQILYIADKDGDNKIPITTSEDIIYSAITRQRDKVITLSNNEGVISIDSIQIR